MRPEPFEERLLDYLDGRLSAEERNRFEEWLREHPAEARRVRQHQQVEQLFTTLEGEEWTRAEQAAFADRVVQRTREGDDAPILTGPGAARWRPWVVIAAAAVVVVAIWLAWPDRNGPEEALTGPEEVAAPVELDQLLTDPEFVAHFDLLQHLEELEESGLVLDLPEDDTFDVVNLEVLAGV